MRKQTKVVAVASAAALLAIGASMTSFAAYGWTPEDGTWYYYDKDGNRVEDEWRKSVDGNWYWLDSEENGAMATDKLIDDDGDIYYVDSEGVMVTNTWVKVVNEDQDDESDPAEYRYYYMQASGKAMKGSSDDLKKKTIDGKKYAFDEDGKMLYGWVGDDGRMMNEEESWKEAAYYFGGWEDGSMKTGWQKINVYNSNSDEDDDADKWFYFKSNGEKVVNKDTNETLETKKVNGKTYGFDEDGVMVYEWNQAATGAEASAANWGYFNSPEDGARVTKGWFKVVPDEAFDQKNSDDEESKWYYSNGDGTLVTSEIKKINGKYYAFNEKGAMLDGLVALETKLGTIEDIHSLDTIDADELDDIIDGTTDISGYNLYYFGDGDDGAMKTGNTTVNLDGDNFAFNFSSTGGADTRGQGTTGLVKKVYYKYGKKMAASTDDKYRAATIDTDDAVTFEASKNLRVNAGDATRKDSNGNVEKLCKYNDITSQNLYLIGTNGQLKKNANGVKDGDDWYFYSDEDGKIIFYANDKDFSKSEQYKAWKAAK